jgi:hypothetical protein
VAGKKMIITLARILLSFFIAVILLGFLWSEGKLPLIENMIWVLIIFLCLGCIYIGKNKTKNINAETEKLFFLVCFIVFLLCLVLNFLAIINSPSKGFLLFMSLPFAAIYWLKKEARESA